MVSVEREIERIMQAYGNGRTAERLAIAAWLRKHGYTQIAQKIEDEEHLK